jgi:hypothetical protein
MHKLDEVLEHSGVKGMKWGIRRDYNRPGGADGKEDGPAKEPGKLQKRINSLSRERSWKKVLSEVDTMNTRDIRIVSNRIKLENSLKAMSKSKMATKKEKQDYLDRHKMSNEELSRKVSRLQAKDDLLKTVSSASKEQREIGTKIAQVGGSLGVKYALNRNITFNDVNDAWNRSKDTYSKAQQDAVTATLKKVKDGKYSDQDKAVNELINTIVKQATKDRTKS